jgi:hypothetical protein
MEGSMSIKTTKEPKKRELRAIYVPPEFHVKIATLAASRDEFIGDMVVKALKQVFPSLDEPRK